MNRFAIVLTTFLATAAIAQTPPAPPGGSKPAPQRVDRVRERADDMRRQIREGRQVKSHVQVRVRLKNGNRLTGVVKNGRLVERVDGLRFVGADARDRGAGIRLWYTGGTRNFIFVPFASLKSYEVVQRLSQKQLDEIESDMQMAEKRAEERAARAARAAKGSAQVAGPQSGGELKPGGPLGQPPAAPGQAVGEAATDAKGASTSTAKTTGAQQAGTVDGAKPKPAAEGEPKAAAVELRYSELLRTYPPKQGWNAAKKAEIQRRFQVIGAQPSKHEKAFVESFDEWFRACQHFRVDPNIGAEKAPESARERRRSRARKRRDGN